jgi:SAM-dependent methyltransferase
MRALRHRLGSALNEQHRAQARRCAVLVGALTRDRAVARAVLAGRSNLGFCPICGRKVLFVRKSAWLRDNYECLFCRSIPRQRVVIRVLETLFPQWRSMTIHESSPGSPSSDKISRECKHYVPSHFYEDTPLGSYRNGVRCENLEKMTFGDESFDLVITQDVFEHVLNPAQAFGEIARILRPGGAHVFTVPYYYWKRTLIRALESSGGIEYLEPPDYHGNPIDEKGSLVVTEWGPELVDFIYMHSGLTTTIYNIHDVRMGLEAAFLDAFVSVKKR